MECSAILQQLERFCCQGNNLGQVEGLQCWTTSGQCSGWWAGMAIDQSPQESRMARWWPRDTCPTHLRQGKCPSDLQHSRYNLGTLLTLVWNSNWKVGRRGGGFHSSHLSSKRRLARGFIERRVGILQVSCFARLKVATFKEYSSSPYYKNSLYVCFLHI